MEIIIIEDERLTADDLKETILRAEPDTEIIAILYSVKQAVDYFKQGKLPDLIFSDIQLGDGLSFEIFAPLKLKVPVIFCTAYDQYAMNAFKANGIDYLLKPFSTEKIKAALTKYQELKSNFSSKGSTRYDDVIKLLSENRSSKPEAVLVYLKDKIIPIRVDQIALIYLEFDIYKLVTLSGHTYTVSKSLDELENLLPPSFFRVNRQYILNHKIITDVASYFSRKLKVNISIPHNDTITVSKERTPDFLNWLSGEK